jgi:putative FmdB family regulatory protein
MPTYDYICTNCGHTLEVFQPISAKPLKKCPACGKMTLQRQIGAGAALIFKGTGFYETDYRKKPDGGGTPGKDSGTKAAPTPSKDKAAPAKVES